MQPSFEKGVGDSYRTPLCGWAALLRCCLLGTAGLALAACTEGAPPAADGGGAQPPASRSGQFVYERYCFSCHTPGVAGAPKLGDAAAWAPRIAKGREVMLQVTLAGVTPGMPAKGMCFDCTEAELAAAIDYMLPSGQTP